jgi:hypothetical protein
MGGTDGKLPRLGGACGDPDKKYIGEENEYSGE